MICAAKTNSFRVAAGTRPAGAGRGMGQRQAPAPPPPPSEELVAHIRCLALVAERDPLVLVQRGRRPRVSLDLELDLELDPDPDRDPLPAELGVRRRLRVSPDPLPAELEPWVRMPRRVRRRLLLDLDLDLELDLLPEELLAQILSWVPARALVTRCRLVCRRWRDLIDGPTVWRLQGERLPRVRLALEAARFCIPPRWSRVCLLQPFGRNLIRNPCGADQFTHWEVQHGGHGWQVEENRCHVEGAPAQTCFVSSFHWCAKSQLVDLLQEGLWAELLDTHQPEIYISDWWGARCDCGCIYHICVKLLAANRRTKIAEFKTSPEPLLSGSNMQYHQVSHSFRHYGPGVRYVHFFHKGKDTQFWAGHYGARITNSTVMVKLCREREAAHPELS